MKSRCQACRRRVEAVSPSVVSTVTLALAVLGSIDWIVWLAVSASSPGERIAMVGACTSLVLAIGRACSQILHGSAVRDRRRRRDIASIAPRTTADIVARAAELADVDEPWISGSDEAMSVAGEN